MGTGCHECAAICDGVAWSPLTAITSGDERAQSGTTASSVLDRRDLAGAVAVLAGGVGVLVVQEEVVVVVPRAAQDLELLGEVGGPPEHVHAEQPGDAAVHRVDRDRRGAEPEAVVEPGSSRWVSKPRNSTTLALGSSASSPRTCASSSATRSAVRFASGSSGSAASGAHAGLLGVGVAESGVEAGPPQHDEQPVLALVAEEHLDAGDVHARLEPLDDARRLGVGDAPGAAVGDRAVGGEGGRLPRRRRRRRAARSRGRRRTARRGPSSNWSGVVAEQPEVTRARAGRDARADRLDQPGRSLGDELVEVRGVRPPRARCRARRRRSRRGRPSRRGRILVSAGWISGVRSMPLTLLRPAPPRLPGIPGGRGQRDPWPGA